MKKISIVQHVYIITSHITVFSIRDANWMTLPIWRLESISVRLDRFKEKKMSITWQQAKEIKKKKIVVRILYTAKLCYLLVVTLRVQKKWHPAAGCSPFCRIWETTVCIPYHWYTLGVSKGNCFEFWEGWFCDYTFTESSGCYGDICTS